MYLYYFLYNMYLSLSSWLTFYKSIRIWFGSNQNRFKTVFNWYQTSNLWKENPISVGRRHMTKSWLQSGILKHLLKNHQNHVKEWPLWTESDFSYWKGKGQMIRCKFRKGTWLCRGFWEWGRRWCRTWQPPCPLCLWQTWQSSTW